MSTQKLNEINSGTDIGHEGNQMASCDSDQMVHFNQNDQENSPCTDDLG